MSQLATLIVLVVVVGSDALLGLSSCSSSNSLLNTLLPIQLSSNDPEINMTTPQIIARWGYPVETVQTTTTDGYILTIHRIPYGKSGFLFADAGFDVWLGNMRGNTYSKAHTNLSVSSHEFWEFTWDDMMRYDLDAMISAALSATGQSSLYYVGHSQGTLTMFTKLSIDQVFAAKIKKFFALAPVCTLGHIKGLLRAVGELNPLLSLYYDNFGQDEFLPTSAFLELSAQYGCGLLSTINPLCKGVMFSIGGPDTHQFNSSRVPVFIAHTPAGTSSTNFIHLGQMVVSNKLQGYDWGCDEKNIQHYGSVQVPTYSISTVTTPTYLFSSDQDWLANPADVQGYIRSTLKPEIVMLDQKLSCYNHFDYIWGLSATKDVYNPIISIINNDQ